MPALLDTLMSSHALLPRLQCRELGDLNPRPSRCSHPPPERDIRDGDVAADQIPRLRRRRGLGKMLVENRVQPPRLVGVPVLAVGDVLGRVPHEVVRLALHRADAGVLEE